MRKVLEAAQFGYVSNVTDLDHKYRDVLHQILSLHLLALKWWVCFSCFVFGSCRMLS
jgi:hypothetical protein